MIHLSKKELLSNWKRLNNTRMSRDDKYKFKRYTTIINWFNIIKY